jgi:hypothetical protein
MRRGLGVGGDRLRVVAGKKNALIHGEDGQHCGVQSDLRVLRRNLLSQVFREEDPEYSVTMNSWHAITAVSAWDATNPTYIASCRRTFTIVY